MSVQETNLELHNVDMEGTETGPGTAEAMATHGEVSGDESLAASLGLNAQLFGFQLLNFAIVAAIVWFLILKPLTKTLEDRKKKIDESLDNAKEIETKLGMAETKFQERIDEAKVEANAIVEKSHNESKQLAEDMKIRAQAEVEKLVAQAKKNIAQEKESMIEQVRSEASDLVIVALEKVLNEKVDSDVDKKIIQESLKGLKS